MANVPEGAQQQRDRQALEDAITRTAGHWGGGRMVFGFAALAGLVIGVALTLSGSNRAAPVFMLAVLSAAIAAFTRHVARRHARLAEALSERPESATAIK